MARGWESKHVEDQQAQARERRAAPGVREPGAFDERRGLELARADLRSRLQVARSAPQRQALEEALAEIERRMTALGTPAPG